MWPSILRHALSATGGAMFATGLATNENQIMELLGALATVISIIWSMWAKRT